MTKSADFLLIFYAPAMVRQDERFMNETDIFSGPNAGYVLELYDRYLQDPTSVDAPTRAFFVAYPPELPVARNGYAANGASAPPVNAAHVAAATRLARLIRQRGHLGANVDPLGDTREPDAELETASERITPQQLALLPADVVVGGAIARETSNTLEAVARLRQAYSGTIGYEDEHIQNAQERYWLRDAAESRQYFADLEENTDKKRSLLQRLTEVDTFEHFLGTTFLNEKRFSIEGTDMLVPMLDEIIHCAAVAGSREVVLGMAHRGRLNVLAHVLGKPYAMILQEFKKAKSGETKSVSGAGTQGWLGDVKYHLGFHSASNETGSVGKRLTLVPNPSHLEFVNAVAEGQARAVQETINQPGAPKQDDHASLPVLIHGDAAFPGQGIVAETLNLSRLPGYRTGGTIHIIVNNQIGFTTVPSDGRSTLYASDLAKGFEIPIVHVNADDPVACIAAARMAHAYRERFGKDFLIDLVGYRRFGHNEGDEPRTTQPRMYEVVDKHPRLRELWTTELEKQGIVSRDEANAMIAEVQARLRAALDAPRETTEATNGNGHTQVGRLPEVPTGVPIDKLTAFNTALLMRPPGFTANAKSESTFFARRRDAFFKDHGIQWAHAEALAFAAIIADGTPVRLSGQDSERGTFDQRRLVLHDVVTGECYNPLQSLPDARASFAVYNSPLSENAVLGFEYGYNIHAPEALVLWEGQFGDFANGAQVIIDQFITSGYSKWRQTPSLVLLLPHGYEGQGPEHSSARLERFLQLAAADNIRVVNCTTAAQYFHVLRRQAALLKSDPRPLIIMTPKSLLRDPNASSSLSELTEGSFQTVIDDAAARLRSPEITRLVLCTGKVYTNLLYPGGGSTELRPEYLAATGVAAVRVEQLYPFPEQELIEVIRGYPNLREIVWMQEEPRNMGAWNFISPRLNELIKAIDWQGTFYYVGRSEAASPAEGSKPRHDAEQTRILDAALASVPLSPQKGEPKKAEVKKTDPKKTEPVPARGS